MSKNYNIIHLSDLHYSFPKLHAADLRSKRFLGLINEILIKKSYHYNPANTKLINEIFKNIAEKESFTLSPVSMVDAIHRRF